MFDEVQAVIGPYSNCPAVCQAYDPRAVDVARQVSAMVSTHMPNVRLDHVGSTSVPGCAGTGIVDLLLPVPDGEMGKVCELLDRLGFQHQPGDNPFPEDRPMRVGAWDQGGETFQLHVHAIPAASPEIDEIRFLRACLRGDPELVKVYVAQKRAIIAGGVTDPREYDRLKGEFLKSVLG